MYLDGDGLYGKYNHLHYDYYYYDYYLYERYRQWRKHRKGIELPHRTKVIAFETSTNDFLLKTTNNFTSGQHGKWLCSKDFTPGWSSVSFNTTGRCDWQPPQIVLNKTVYSTFEPAKWMRVTGTTEKTIYCRGDYGR